MTDHLRNHVDFDTVVKVATSGYDRSLLGHEIVAEGLRHRLGFDANKKGLLIDALNQARRTGRIEGLEFGYGRPGVVQEIVDSRLNVLVDSITREATVMEGAPGEYRLIKLSEDRRTLEENR